MEVLNISLLLLFGGVVATSMSVEVWMLLRHCPIETRCSNGAPHHWGVWVCTVYGWNEHQCQKCGWTEYRRAPSRG